MRTALAFATAICLALAATPPEESEKLEELRQTFEDRRSECMNELGMTNETLTHHLKNLQNFTLPENYQCLYKCVGDKLGVYVDGKLSDEKVEALLANVETGRNETDSLLDFYNSCKNETGVNECETATKIVGCVHVRFFFRSVMQAIETSLNNFLGQLLNSLTGKNSTQ